MNKKFIKLLLVAVILFTATFSASAQVYVQIRPTFPVIVRPPQPTPAYVWVNEEWEPNGNSYRYSGGHWEAPAHPGYYRRQGHWQKASKGQMWVPGGWDKNDKDYYKPGKHGKHGKHDKHDRD